MLASLVKKPGLVLGPYPDVVAPLVSSRGWCEPLVPCIASATTTGLTVRAEYDGGPDPTGIGVTDEHSTRSMSRGTPPPCPRTPITESTVRTAPYSTSNPSFSSTGRAGPSAVGRERPRVHGNHLITPGGAVHTPRRESAALS